MASTMNALYPSVNQYWGTKDTYDYISMPGVFSDAGYKTIFVDDIGKFVPNLGADIVKNGFSEVVKNLKITEWKDYIQNMEEGGPYFVYLYSSSLHDYFAQINNASYPEKQENSNVYFNNRGDYYTHVGKYLFEHKNDYFTEKSIDLNGDLRLETIDDGIASRIYKYYLNNSGNLDNIKKHAVEADFFYEVVSPENKQKISNELKTLYDNGLKKIDYQLKDLLEYLSSPEISKNTIVVFTSSHGEAFGEHGFFFHTANIYNEIFHTPLIISADDYKPKRIEQATRNIDIFPTLASLTGITVPENIQGISLKNLLARGFELKTRYAFSEETESELALAIQDQKWKLIVRGGIYSENYDLELYNLEKDPQEKVNVRDDNPKKANSLLNEIKKIIDESHKLRIRSLIPFPSYLDEEQQEDMMKRGYF